MLFLYFPMCQAVSVAHKAPETAGCPWPTADTVVIVWWFSVKGVGLF